MKLFETREEKQIREEKEEEMRNEQLRQEREESKRKKEQEKRSRQEKFMHELEEETNKKIITILLYNGEGNELKELAMNHLLEKGYVCVQNDVQTSKYDTAFALTFVKKEDVGFFPKYH